MSEAIFWTQMNAIFTAMSVMAVFALFEELIKRFSRVQE